MRLTWSKIQIQAGNALFRSDDPKQKCFLLLIHIKVIVNVNSVQSTILGRISRKVRKSVKHKILSPDFRTLLTFPTFGLFKVYMTQV